MPTPNNGNTEPIQGTPPAPSPGDNGNTPPVPPVEGADAAKKGIDFDAELAALEAEKNKGSATPPAPAPAPKSPEEELKQATFSLKSIGKRVKQLGGDPNAILGDEGGEAPPPPVPSVPVIDESRFVTKADMARSEAEKLAQSPGELKLIMWYVENKGLTVTEAHLLANKGRINKTMSEIQRSQQVTPQNGGQGAGQPPKAPDANDVPALSAIEVERLTRSGMVYDPTKKAYVGQKMQYRFDTATKSWKNERRTP